MVLHKKISNEYQFILSCLQSFINKTEEWSCNFSEIDFEKVFELISHHHISSTIHIAITRLNFWDELPKSFCDKMNALFLTASFLAQIKSEEVKKVIQITLSHGIRILPWRGPVLAEQIYGTISSRNFGDLDFIFNKGDLKALKNALSEIGYHRQKLEIEEETLLEEEHALAFLKKEKGVSFELDFHWSIAEKYWNLNYPDKEIWSRLQKYNFRGNNIEILSPDDLILCLSIHHGLRSNWRKLKYICDFALIMKHYNTIDFLKLMNRAKSIGIDNSFLTGVYVAREMLGITLHKDLLRILFMNPRVKWAGNAVIDRLLRAEKKAQRETFFTQFLGHRNFLPIFFKLVTKRTSKLLTPNEQDKSVVSLPKNWQFLYYFVRPFRLMKKFGLREGLGIFFKKI